MPANYPALFRALLEPMLKSGGTVSANHLFAEASLGKTTGATKLRHLKAFLSLNPEYVGTVEGVLPGDEGIIHAIELQLGAKVVEGNVVHANQICADIVMAAAKPLLESFVREALAKHVTGTEVTIALNDLIDFLVEEYGPFARGAGNSLVATAGRMNERLLMACLEAAGMIQGTDFTKTGAKSEGDVVIHSQAGPKTNLGVEVKSYHARERLQRGLADVREPKVGAGYFKNSLEFGAKRTSSLIQTNTAAVYMPAATLAQIHKSIRDQKVHDKIADGSRFYRPIEQFATDMKAYVATGKLPKF